VRAFLIPGLILCNLIWSTNPVMGKVLFERFEPIQVAWIRTFGAWLATVTVLVVIRLRRVGSAEVETPLFYSPPSELPSPARRRRWSWLFLLGTSAFLFAPLIAMLGLHRSSAIDNSLIVGLEPLATIGLAALVLGEKPLREQGLALVFAVIGFCLLSGLTWNTLCSGWDGHLVGNLLILTSLLGEAGYSVCFRKLKEPQGARRIFASAVTIGAAGLTLVVLGLGALPPLRPFLESPRLLGAALWIGPLGTAATYLFWMQALEFASIPMVALTLFVQPLAGPVWGALFFGESLSGLRVLGAFAILLALVLSVKGEFRRSAPSKEFH